MDKPNLYNFKLQKNITILMVLIFMVVNVVARLASAPEEVTSCLLNIFTIMLQVMWATFCQYRAYIKGYKAFVWWILGFVFGIIAYIIISLIPKSKINQNEDIDAPKTSF